LKVYGRDEPGAASFRASRRTGGNAMKAVGVRACKPPEQPGAGEGRSRAAAAALAAAVVDAAANRAVAATGATPEAR
jgi:hypothetical protein